MGASETRRKTAGEPDVDLNQLVEAWAQTPTGRTNGLWVYGFRISGLGIMSFK